MLVREEIYIILQLAVLVQDEKYIRLQLAVLVRDEKCSATASCAGTRRDILGNKLSVLVPDEIY